MMYDLVFFYSSVRRGGSELALLRYLKLSKKKYNIVLAYYKDTSDEGLLEEFEKVITVKKLSDGEILNAKVGVNCMISTTGSGFFDKVQADKYILWVQVNPKIYSNYKDFDKYHRFLTTSQYIKNVVLEYPGIKESDVYLVNPLVDVLDIKSKANVSQKILNNNIFNFITLARVTHEKGYDYMIEVARKLKLRGILFKWYMLGFVSLVEEEYYQTLLSKIEEYDLMDNIFFLGAKENPYKYLAKADVNILLSKNEAWCLAVTEAKILKVPSIVSNNSALKEQIENGVNGFLVDLPQNDQDYDEIVDRIQELIENKELYNKIVNNLDNFVFNEEAIIKNTDECFYSYFDEK